MGLFNDIYTITKQIPAGKVATYGQIARLAGNPRASRQVGWALHQNPEPGVIPCHRVVNRFGGLCPSFAFGGADVQKQLLEVEGIEVDTNNKIDLEKYQWRSYETT